MAPKSTRRQRFALEGIHEGTRSARFVASTANPVTAPDGVPEILQPPWRLERFNANPVVFFNHRTGDLPIGTGGEIEQGPDGLGVRVFFDVDDESERIWQKVRRRVLRAASVQWSPGPTREEDRDGKRVRVVESPELLELSVVGLPQDPDALVDEPTPAAAPARSEPKPEPEPHAEELGPHEAEPCRGCEKRPSLRSAYRWEDCMADQVAEHGDETKAGETCRAARAKPAAEDEEALKQRSAIVAAARLLRSARNLKQRAMVKTDATDDGTVLRVDASFGRLGKVERTQIGGARIAARMSRTGVFTYQLGGGKVRRELRLPEEVGKAESLATLRGAPIVVGHPYELGGEIDASTYRAYTKGHVEGGQLSDTPHTDGERWIEGTVLVQDAPTLDAIDSGDLGGLSLGYRSKLEFTPGTWRGQPYDAIQRNIRYNHLAVLKPNGGRAGAPAELKLDGFPPDAGICVHEDETEDNNMDPKTIKLIRLDGREYEIGSEEHLIKLDEMHAKEVTALTTKHSADISALTRTSETYKANLDAAEAKVKKLETDLAEANDQKRLDAKVTERVDLLTNAQRILGDDVKLDGKTEREIWVECIKSDRKDFEDKDARTGKPYTDDYLRATFENLAKSGVRNDGVDGIVKKLRRSSDDDDMNLDEDLDNMVVNAQIREAKERARGGQPKKRDDDN